MMEVTVPYLLRCTAALMLLLAGPVFAQTADEAAISKLLGAVKRSGVTVIALETLTDSLLLPLPRRRSLLGIPREFHIREP